MSVIERHFPVSENLKRLCNAVLNSKIEYEFEGKGAMPYCTVNGKRQVISVNNNKGYDLWVPKRKPIYGAIHNDMKLTKFDASFEQAVAFLEGAFIKDIENI